jgi:hypothetical protein
VIAHRVSATKVVWIENQAVKVSIIFFKQEVTFLGHMVSENGVKTDPGKVNAVSNWPTPKCAKELRSFLGLCSYYRKYVNGFALIASPLHAIILKHGGKGQKADGATDSGGRSNLPLSQRWTVECKSAFEHLKKCLVCWVIQTLRSRLCWRRMLVFKI